MLCSTSANSSAMRLLSSLILPSFSNASASSHCNSSIASSFSASICSRTASVFLTIALPWSVCAFSTFGDCAIMSLFKLSISSNSLLDRPLFSANLSYSASSSAIFAGFCVTSNSFVISSNLPNSSVVNLLFSCSASYLSANSSTALASSHNLSAVSVDTSLSLCLSLYASYAFLPRNANAPPASTATPAGPPNKANLPIRPVPLATPSAFDRLPATRNTPPMAVAVCPKTKDAGPTAATSATHFNICFCCSSSSSPNFRTSSV